MTSALNLATADCNRAAVCTGTGQERDMNYTGAQFITYGLLLRLKSLFMR